MDRKGWAGPEREGQRCDGAQSFRSQSLGNMPCPPTSAYRSPALKPKTMGCLFFFSPPLFPLFSGVIATIQKIIVDYFMDFSPSSTTTSSSVNPTCHHLPLHAAFVSNESSLSSQTVKTLSFEFLILPSHVFRRPSSALFGGKKKNQHHHTIL